MMMRDIAGCAAKASTLCRSIGLPETVRYCFGTSPPLRLPVPAATMIAAIGLSLIMQRA
jgi:hypothetical protein